MLTAKQAGAILGISPRAVYQLGRLGLLTEYRPTAGRRAVRYAQAKVEARAGVEPTYTDLQSERALQAKRAALVEPLRMERLKGVIRPVCGNFFPYHARCGASRATWHAHCIYAIIAPR